MHFGTTSIVPLDKVRNKEQRLIKIYNNPMPGDVSVIKRVPSINLTYSQYFSNCEDNRNTIRYAVMDDD